MRTCIPTRLRSVRGQAAALLLGAACAVLLLELGLRVVGLSFLGLQGWRNRLALGRPGAVRILCVGDSMTALTYPRYLESILNESLADRRFVVIDGARPATDSADALAILPGQLAEFGPDMVVVMMGGNDGGHVLPYGRLRADDQRAVKSLRLGKILGDLIARRSAGAAEADGSPAAARGVSDAGMFKSMGTRYLRAGEYRKAERAFKRALALDPDDDHPYGGLAAAYAFLGRRDLEAACLSEALALQERRFKIMTRDNYLKLRRLVAESGARLVCVPYPRQSLVALAKMFDDPEGIVFVDNAEPFEKALRGAPATDYFADFYGGSFGHCTPKGYRLLARNIAAAILRDISSGDFDRFLRGRRKS